MGIIDDKLNDTYKPNNEGYSIFDGDTWSKAAEGLKYSLLGSTDNPTAEDLTLNEGMTNVGRNVAEGISNAGNQAGVNAAKGMSFISELLGADNLSDKFDTYVTSTEGNIPDSSIGALIGSEALGAATGGALGKGYQLYRQNKLNRGKSFIEDELIPAIFTNKQKADLYKYKYTDDEPFKQYIPAPLDNIGYKAAGRPSFEDTVGIMDQLSRKPSLVGQGAIQRPLVFDAIETVTPKGGQLASIVNKANTFFPTKRSGARELLGNYSDEINVNKVNPVIATRRALNPKAEPVWTKPGAYTGLLLGI